MLKNKRFTYGLLGSLGLGMMLLGVPQSAKAATLVNAGTDYIRTPSGDSTFDFPQLGSFVTFKGLRIGKSTGNSLFPDGGDLGKADTVINRIDDVDLRTTNSGRTNIEVVGLSLQSVNAVNGMDVFAGLQKYRTDVQGQLSTGTMDIRDNFTWDSNFDLNGTAIMASAGSLNPTNNDFVRGLIAGCDGNMGTHQGINYTCIDFSKPFAAFNADWSDTHGNQLTGRNLVSSAQANFFITGEADHTATAANHNVTSNVPEPVTTAASILFGIFGSVFKMKKNKKAISAN